MNTFKNYTDWWKKYKKGLNKLVERVVFLCRQWKQKGVIQDGPINFDATMENVVLR